MAQIGVEYFAKERELPTSSSFSQCLRHPGGARARGLRIVESNQPHETGDMASKRPVRSCYRQEPKDLTAILIDFFLVAFRVQSDATH